MENNYQWLFSRNSYLIYFSLNTPQSFKSFQLLLFVLTMTELAMNSSSLDSTFTQYQINIELSNG